MQNIYESEEFREYYSNLKNKLYQDQKRSLDFIRNRNKATVHQPTGTGKSYIIYSSIIDILRKSGNDICAIASHRLMLNAQHMIDIFKEYKFALGAIGYVYVGSNNIPIKKFRNKEINKKLKELGLNYGDLIKFARNKNEVNQYCKEFLDKDMDVIVISTYHSLDKLKTLDIHTIYCDEAHLLASPEVKSDFKNNFEKIKAKNTYFFTATPKDSVDDETEAFLMNNKDIFGERCGVTFKESVERGYIVPPVTHIAIPSNYTGDEFLMNADNYSFFIKEVFSAHNKWLKQESGYPDLIEPKLLVKCPSVPMMWQIRKKLIKDKDLEGINILAGASNNEEYIGDMYVNMDIYSDRNEYLEYMRNMSDLDSSIILHYDILSEGINVPGITGVAFMSKTQPTLPKILQNAGRSTRKNIIDSEKFYKGEITTDNRSEWVKPYCAIILPVYDKESEHTKNQISKTIKSLRDEFGFEPIFKVSEGDDFAEPDNDKEDDDNLNNVNKKKKESFIDDIVNEIERLDQIDDLSEFKKKVSGINDINEQLNLLNW